MRHLRAIGPSTIEPEGTIFRTAGPGAETNFPAIGKLPRAAKATKGSVL
jgi:hypothetical protein